MMRSSIRTDTTINTINSQGMKLKKTKKKLEHNNGLFHHHLSVCDNHENNQYNNIMYFSKVKPTKMKYLIIFGIYTCCQQKN